jgi:hypothetical protein
MEKYPPNTYLIFVDTWNKNKILHRVPLHRETEYYMEIQKQKWLDIILEGNYVESQIEIKIITKTKI